MYVVHLRLVPRRTSLDTVVPTALFSLCLFFAPSIPNKGRKVALCESMQRTYTQNNLALEEYKVSVWVLKRWKTTTRRKCASPKRSTESVCKEEIRSKLLVTVKRHFCIWQQFVHVALHECFLFSFSSSFCSLVFVVWVWQQNLAVIIFMIMRASVTHTEGGSLRAK